MKANVLGVLFALIMACCIVYADDCDDDKDCDSDQWVGSPWCYNNDVYQKWRDYWCDKGDCRYDEDSRKKEECDDGVPWTYDYCSSSWGAHCVHETINHPYSFTPSTTSVCSNAYLGVTAKKAYSHVSDTTFNYYIGSTLARTNCPTAGDSNWGPNQCGVSTYGIPAGTYVLKAVYNLWGRQYEEVITNNLVVVGSCDYCSAQCTHGWQAQSATTYTVNFGGSDYKISGGSYILCPDCVMQVKDISNYVILCSNGVWGATLSSLRSWTYKQETNEKLSVSDNHLSVTQNKDRADILGVVGRSSTCGLPILASYGKTQMEVYNFTSAGNYTVYLDEISGICDSPAYYACPWFSSGSTLCQIGVYRYVERPWGIGGYSLVRVGTVSINGWTALNRYPVFIPYSNLTVEEPEDIFDPVNRTVQASWTIKKTGPGDEYVWVTRNCGDWSCEFIGGYTEGKVVTMRDGDALTVTLNITTKPSEIYSRSIGVTVHYDDAYNLSCIRGGLINSSINITLPHTL